MCIVYVRSVEKCRRASTSVVSQERNGEKREYARARARSLSLPPPSLTLSLSLFLSRSIARSLARSHRTPYFSSLSLSRSFSLTRTQTHSLVRSLFLAAPNSVQLRRISASRNAHRLEARKPPDTPRFT